MERQVLDVRAGVERAEKGRRADRMVWRKIGRGGLNGATHTASRGRGLRETLYYISHPPSLDSYLIEPTHWMLLEIPNA